MPVARRAYTPDPGTFTINDGVTWTGGAASPSTNADYDVVGVLWSINTADRQLRRSTDDGITWSGAIGIAIPGADTIQNGGLACGSGQTILVVLLSATNSFVAVTLNQGATWTIYTVAVDPSYRQCTLMYNPIDRDFCLIARFAADFGSRIIRSSDTGQTWTVVDNYGASSTSGAFTDALFVTRASTWLASQSFQSQVGPDRVNRILRSTDGLTWTVVHTSPFGDEKTGDLNAFVHSKFSQALSGAQVGRIRLGRYRSSDDDGQTWAYTFVPPNTSGCYWQTIGAQVAREAEGVNDRMRRSTDGGETWIDGPLIGANVRQIIVSASVPAPAGKAKKMGGSGMGLPFVRPPS